MKSVAVILARGGSKGIPQKNIIPLHNKPLIEYTITAAKQSNVDEVWVSTDCENIKSVAINLGVEVLDRPKKFATDSSKSEDALLHFSEKVSFDLLVFIQPTSPLVLPHDINVGLDMMHNQNQKYDSVFSAYKEHWLPRWAQNKTPINWDTQKRPMRQDEDELYVENGAFYITTKNALHKSNLRYSGNIGVVEMPFSRSFQIDTPDDLSLIKRLLNE